MPLEYRHEYAPNLLKMRHKWAIGVKALPRFVYGEWGMRLMPLSILSFGCKLLLL